MHLSPPTVTNTYTLTMISYDGGTNMFRGRSALEWQSLGFALLLGTGARLANVYPVLTAVNAYRTGCWKWGSEGSEGSDGRGSAMPPGAQVSVLAATLLPKPHITTAPHHYTTIATLSPPPPSPPTPPPSFTTTLTASTLPSTHTHTHKHTYPAAHSNAHDAHPLLQRAAGGGGIRAKYRLPQRAR